MISALSTPAEIPRRSAAAQKMTCQRVSSNANVVCNKWTNIQLYATSKSRANILPTLSTAVWEKNPTPGSKYQPYLWHEPLQSPRSRLQLLKPGCTVRKSDMLRQKVQPYECRPRICSYPLRLEIEDICPTTSAGQLSRGSDTQ
jgi:hypothetical protein